MTKRCDHAVRSRVAGSAEGASLPSRGASNMLLDCVGFTLIIDDIVRPNGTTYMQQLGGGGPQTLFGFQLISHCLGIAAQLGLAAGVGQDLPTECKIWLTALHVDVGGLIEGPQPTPRAWQLFEEDGTRTQVWRVPDCPELYQQLRPNFEQLPHQFQSSRNYHLGIHASHPPMKLLRALRNAAHSKGGLLSVETYTSCDTPPSPQQLRELLAVVDVFSPNADEAVSLVGPGPPRQLVEQLLQLGGKTVVLRMGEAGVLVGQMRLDGQAVHIQVPAVPETEVVDVTGCGNAFCGGFLAGIDAGLTLEQSAVWGCVAGSIMAEAQGVPTADVQSLLFTANAKQQHLLATLGMMGGAPEDDCSANVNSHGSQQSQPPAGRSGRCSSISACLARHWHFHRSTHDSQWYQHALIANVRGACSWHGHSVSRCRTVAMHCKLTQFDVQWRKHQHSVALRPISRSPVMLVVPRGSGMVQVVRRGM